MKGFNISLCKHHLVIRRITVVNKQAPPGFTNNSKRLFQVLEGNVSLLFSLLNFGAANFRMAMFTLCSLQSHTYVQKTNDSVSRQKRGSNLLHQSECLQSGCMQQQESPLLQLPKLCLSGVKFTQIFIELTKHYHWQFLWVA